MRKYGKVSTALFTDPKSAAWDDVTFRVAIYLLAGPHANLIGCFRMPTGYLAVDLAKPKARVKQAIRKLETDGWLKYCEETKWVWIKKFILHNQFESPNVAKAAMNTMEDVPKELCYYDEFIEKTKTYGKWTWGNGEDLFKPNARLSVGIAKPKGISRAPARAPVPEPEPEPKPEPSKEKKTDKKKESALSRAPLPENLNHEAWDKWIKQRRKRRKPKYTTNKMVEELAQLPHDQQMECVDESIKQEWTGLFPGKFSNQKCPAEDAWDKVLNELPNSQKATTDDSITLKVVKTMGGWLELGKTSNYQLTFKKRDFIKRYKQLTTEKNAQ